MSNYFVSGKMYRFIATELRHVDSFSFVMECDNDLSPKKAFNKAKDLAKKSAMRDSSLEIAIERFHPVDSMFSGIKV